MIPEFSIPLLKKLLGEERDPVTFFQQQKVSIKISADDPIIELEQPVEAQMPSNDIYVKLAKELKQIFREKYAGAVPIGPFVNRFGKKSANKTLEANMTAKEGIYQFKNKLLEEKKSQFTPNQYFLLDEWNNLFTQEYYDQWFITSYEDLLYWYETYQNLMQSSLPDSYHHKFAEKIDDSFHAHVTPRLLSRGRIHDFRPWIWTNRLTEEEILQLIRGWADSFIDEELEDYLQEEVGDSGMTESAYYTLENQLRRMVKETITMDYFLPRFETMLKRLQNDEGGTLYEIDLTSL